MILARLVGKSGVKHEFSHARSKNGELSVTVTYERPVGAIEFLEAWMMAFDVGATVVEVLAPAFGNGSPKFPRVKILRRTRQGSRA